MALQTEEKREMAGPYSSVSDADSVLSEIEAEKRESKNKARRNGHNDRGEQSSTDDKLSRSLTESMVRESRRACTHALAS